MKRFYEEWAVIATVDPVDGNAGDASSDAWDWSLYEEVAVIVSLGVLNDSATDAIAVQASANSNGSSGTTITGKTISVVGTDDAKQFIITILPDEVQSQLGSSYRYGIVTQDNSAHSQLLSIVVLGKAKYGNARDVDLSTVQTVVD